MSHHPAERPASACSSPAEAVERMLACVRPVEAEDARLERAGGRVLAQRVLADRPSPAVDVSAVDGFAVRTGDLRPGTVEIIGEVRIGQAPPALPASAGAGRVVCIRQVTGGAIPPGADAVIKREDVRELEAAIVLGDAAAAGVRPGDGVRRSGENASAGAMVAEPGAELSPALIGALAAVGCLMVRIHRPLRIGVLTTGDELVRPGEAPTPWQLRDSNGPALAALIGAPGWVAGVEARHVRDEESALGAALAELLPRCDALLLTGGVSAGHRDFVPAALARAGVGEILHRVPQRPGRPLWCGVTRGGAPVFGLPGNPVSVLVTARRIALPVLARCAGVARVAPPAMVRVVNPDAKSIPLWWHRPAALSGCGEVSLIDTRGSGDLIGAARTDGFVEIPPGLSGAGPWPFYGWSV